MIDRFDNYTVRARVAPIFLVLFPLILISTVTAPKVQIFQAISGSLLLTLALSLLGAQFSRDRGKIKEAELWRSWGGAPTTQILRHRNTDFNPIRRSRIHNNLQEMLPDIQLPTPDQEKEYPEQADQIYEACIRHLISRTRDIKKYPLVFKENINYGFLRNLWGLKPYGISISIIGMIVLFLYIRIEWINSYIISYQLIVVTLINLSILYLWIFWLKPERVKIAAVAYSERLVECCE